jgi:hypothetical protein
METPNTDLLIGVINRFKIIKRIDFDNDDHRKFVGEVFRACKEAKPEIEALRLLVQPKPYMEQTGGAFTRAAIEGLTRELEAEEEAEDPAIAKARKAATKGKTRLKVGGDGAGINLESKIS